MTSDKYDAIIIGAGLSGLSCGSILSQNGKSVLVIEKHDKVGGFATKFKRKGYTFDVSLHNVGSITENEVLKKMLIDLKVFDKLEFIPFNEFQHLIYPEHDLHLVKGVDKIIERLNSLFPSEVKGIEKLFDKMKAIREEFDEIELLDVSIDKLEEVYPMLPVKFPMLVQLVYTTFRELLDEHLNDEKLKGIISSLWWLYGIPPSKVASILYSVPSINYFNYAGGFIKGTSQNLSDALADVIKDNNGEILLNSEVSQVIVEDGKSVGIQLDDGTVIKSDIVVSCASAKNLYLDMIDREKLPKRFDKKINKLELSLSGLQLYLGVKGRPEDFNIQGHNITVFESYDHELNYKWAYEGNYEKVFYSLTCYSKFDNSLAVEDKTVISIMTLDHIDNWKDLTDDEYKQRKQEVSDIFINRIEKIYPGLKDAIEVLELGTPRTMMRYTGHPDGTIYGLAQTVDQSGVNRLSIESPISGLYITGAYVYPGAGYSSVISSGYRTAKLILK